MSEQRAKASGPYCADNSPWGGAVFILAGLRQNWGEPVSNQLPDVDSAEGLASLRVTKFTGMMEKLKVGGRYQDSSNVMK